MGRASKKLLSLITTVTVMSTVMVSNVSATNIKDSSNIKVLENEVNMLSAEKNELPEEIEDGIILHAWNWSFVNIEKYLDEIKAAGYNTIQTSPAQQCRKGSSWNKADKAQTNSNPTWNYLYQPTYFTVGNDYLGTEDELKSMTKSAHSKGIKVIVDVVANHLADTNDSNLVDKTLLSSARTLSNGGHRIGGTEDNPISGDWKNRTSVTQGCCIGMPDLNTKNKETQNIIGGYLEELVEDGVDGFRLDAAKSIELPKEYEPNLSEDNCSDFWPTVLGMADSKAKDQNKTLFYYGEVLQGDEPGTNAKGYANSGLMRISGSMFGQDLRYAVGYDYWQEEENGHDVIHGEKDKNGVTTVKSVNNVALDQVRGSWSPDDDNNWSMDDISNDKYVSFIETHDLYGNAGATRCMTLKQRQMAWAMLTARDKIVPLFFNRPVDRDFGSNPLSPQGEAYVDVGEKGSDDFKDETIVAINKFHNEMVGCSEKVDKLCPEKSGSDQTDYYKVIKIERLNDTKGKGIVMVNVGDNAKDIDTSTSLPDGKYINKVGNKEEFTVSNGKIKGNLPGSSIAILYNEDEPVEEVEITANPSSGTFEESQDVNLTLENADNGTYIVKEGSEEIESGDFKNGETITIGKEAKEGSTITLEVTAGDKTETYTYVKTEASIMARIKADPSEGEFKDSIKVKLELLELSNGKYVVTEGENDLESGSFEDGDEIQIGKDAKEGSTITLTLTADEGNKVTYTYKKSKTEVGDLSVELNASKTEAVVNETIDLEATSSNTDVTYTYKVVKPNGKKVTLQNNNGKASLIVSQEGTYSVEVTATDEDGNSATDSVEIVVTKKEQEENKKLEIVSIEADVESGKLEAGKSTYITTTTKNSIDDVYYKYYINNTAVTEWVNDPQYKWTPDEEGTYTIQVKVKDSRNEIATKSIEYKVIKATEEESSVVINDVTISPKEIKAGDKVSIIVDAEGNGELLYKYEIKDKDEKVIDSSSKYGNENEFVVQIDSEGEYTLTVYVKDESQNEPVQKVVKLNVEKKNDDQSSEEGTGEHNGFGMLAGLLSVSAIALFSTKRKEN